MKFFENIKTIIGEIIGLIGGCLWAIKTGWTDYEPLILLVVSAIGLAISLFTKFSTKENSEELPKKENKDAIAYKNYTIRTFVENNEVISELNGTLEVNTLTWKTKTNLPLFKTIPKISLNRTNGEVYNLPTITEVTEDSFTISINNSGDAGQWNWRAIGKIRE